MASATEETRERAAKDAARDGWEPEKSRRAGHL